MLAASDRRGFVQVSKIPLTCKRFVGFAFLFRFGGGGESVRSLLVRLELMALKGKQVLKRTLLFQQKTSTQQKYTAVMFNILV